MSEYKYQYPFEQYEQIEIRRKNKSGKRMRHESEPEIVYVLKEACYQKEIDEINEAVKRGLSKENAAHLELIKRMTWLSYSVWYYRYFKDSKILQKRLREWSREIDLETYTEAFEMTLLHGRKGIFEKEDDEDFNPDGDAEDDENSNPDGDAEDDENSNPDEDAEDDEKKQLVSDLQAIKGEGAYNSYFYLYDSTRDKNNHGFFLFFLYKVENRIRYLFARDKKRGWQDITAMGASGIRLGEAKNTNKGLLYKRDRKDMEPVTKSATKADPVLGRQFIDENYEDKLANDEATLSLLSHIIGMKRRLQEEHGRSYRRTLYGIAFFTSLIVSAVKESKSPGSLAGNELQTYRSMDHDLLDFTYQSFPANLREMISTGLKTNGAIFPDENTESWRNEELKTPFTLEVLAAYFLRIHQVAKCSPQSVKKMQDKFREDIKDRKYGDAFAV